MLHISDKDVVYIVVEEVVAHEWGSGRVENHIVYRSGIKGVVAYWLDMGADIYAAKIGVIERRSAYFCNSRRQ